MAKIQTIRVRYDINTDAVEATQKAWDQVEQSVEGTEESSKQLRNEFKKQVKSIEELRKQEQALKKERDKSTDPKKIQQFNQKIKGTQAEMRKLSGETQKTGSAFDDLVSSIGTGIAIAGVAEIGRQAIESAIEFEQLQISFETFLGSAEKAKETIAGLESFAGATPFTTEEVLNAGRSLLAFGESADTVEETLRRLGDISAGTGKDFGELATLFGKARVSGVLMAEDINQFTEAGIPIIDEFAKILGVSASEVKKMASESKISFGTLQQAIQNMTSEGGKFAGLTEKLSQSTGGLISTLQSNVQILLRDIGTALLPVVNTLVVAFGDLLTFTKDLYAPFIDGFRRIGAAISRVSESVQTGGEKFSVFGTIIKAITFPFVAINKALGFVVSGFGRLIEGASGFVEQSPFLLKAVNAIGSGFRALGNAIDAVYGFFDNFFSSGQKAVSTMTLLNTRLENLGLTVKEIIQPLGNIFKEQLGATTEELTKFTNQFDIGLLRNATSVQEASKIITIEFRKWRESQKQTGAAIGDLGKETKKFAEGSIAQLEDSLQKLNQRFKETDDSFMRMRIAAGIADINLQLEILRRQGEEMKGYEPVPVKNIDLSKVGINELADRYAAVTAEIEATKNEVFPEGETLFPLPGPEEFEKAIQLFTEFGNTIGAIQQAQKAQELASIDERYRKEIERAGDNAKKKEEIEKKYQAEREAIDKEFAQQQQKLALFQAVINTASAITKALSSAPPPFSFILASLVGAQGLAQIATIQAQQFAEGGLVEGGTPNKDSVPALLMPDEFVITKQRYREYKPIIDAIHDGKYPKSMLEGGLIIGGTGGSIPLEFVKEIQGLRMDLKRQPKFEINGSLLEKALIKKIGRTRYLNEKFSMRK